MNRGNTVALIDSTVSALEESGLRADRPAAPVQVTYYYSTDADQLELYIPSAARWFVIG